MTTEATISHISEGINFEIPAQLSDGVTYFGDFDILEKYGLLGLSTDTIYERVNQLTKNNPNIENYHSRTARVFRIDDYIVKEGAINPIACAIVEKAMTKGLENVKTISGDKVSLPKFIAGVKNGYSGLLMTEYIPEHLPIPDFGPAAIDEFAFGLNKRVRIKRYFAALDSVGFFENIDTRSWDDNYLYEYFDDALTNTLWPQEFEFDSNSLILPKNYYRIDFDSINVPKKDIIVN